MAHRGAQAPSPSNPPPERLAGLAACFERLAVLITERRPDAELVKVLEETRARCAAAAPGRSSEAEEWLPRLTLAVETWQSVWARLGTQQEFRLAVAREARLWASRLRAMSGGTTSSRPG